MVEFVFPPPNSASVAISGSTNRFPVRRIICVGRNYAAHAREMGNDPDREPPFFFFKPSDAVVDEGAVVPYPPLTTNLHFEVELVVAISTAGSDIPSEQALDHVFGYGVGIDLTRRDLQLKAREMGRPWDWGKGFDRSAPCSALHLAADVGHPEAGRIWLSVNGTIKQDSNLNDLIWPVADIISLASNAMELQPGDLIYTGTPEGVGPIERGDHVAAGIDGVGLLNITIG